MAKSLLIDVRSAEEYETGYLSNAINIEYVSIAELATIQPDINHDDKITLYCRSGRRSAIALDTLQALGFTNVRDIGSYKQAEWTLRLEASSPSPLLVKPISDARASASAPSKESLQLSTKKLIDGLRGLE